MEKMIQKEDIERLLRNEVKLQSYVDQAFKEELFKVASEEKPEYNGIQLINSKVIVSYLKQLLRNDFFNILLFEMVAMEKKGFRRDNHTNGTRTVHSPPGWDNRTVWMLKGSTPADC